MTVRGEEFKRSIALTTTNGMSIRGRADQGALDVLITGPRAPHLRLVLENAMLLDMNGGSRHCEEISVYMGEVVTWYVIP